MSSQTSELLEAFESLPPEEKRIFTAEFFHRTIPFDSGHLTTRKQRALPTNFSLLAAEENAAISR